MRLDPLPDSVETEIVESAERAGPRPGKSATRPTAGSPQATGSSTAMPVSALRWLAKMTSMA